MAARGSQSTAFADLNEFLENSHIFLPVKSADAEVFPCIHVLCSSCLETISSRSGQKSGDKMVCRVCKLEFATPSRKVLRDRNDPKELLSELSKAANDCKWCQSCFEIRQYRWSELDGQSASMFCTGCTKYECLMCSNKNLCNYRGHRTIVMGSHLTEKTINHVKYEWHKKRLDVFCLVCDKSSCFLCLVDNIPNVEMKNDFEKQIGLNIELQSLIVLSNELFDCKSEVDRQRRQYESSVMKMINQIEEKFRAMPSKRELLLSKLRLIDSEKRQSFEKDSKLIDALSKDANNYVSSCKLIQSSRDLGEKFCALGATLKKSNELRLELDHSIKPRLLPTTPFESSDLEKWLETNERSDDDAKNKTTKYEAKSEARRTLYKSELQVPSSTSRSKDVISTFNVLIGEDPNREDRENTFSDELSKYREMLEEILDKMIPDKIRTKTKQRTSLLKKEGVDRLRQLFIYVKDTRHGKMETAQWRHVERCHENLVRLSCIQADGDRFKQILDEIRGIIEDELKQMTALGLHGTRYQQGLSNFGNTCYFNAVVQCLCQSYLMKELYLVNTSKEPLTEAFVQFLNYRSAGEHDQEAAFYKFFEQLFTSSPKFNNWQQHDSHDLFIHFLNDLRSEERLHITGSSQSSVDPRKVLTAVDKVFGGHFITMYSCLKCNNPYFVCECLLDISLPICIPKEQKQQQPFRGGGIRGTHQTHSGQQNHGSKVEEHQQHSQTSYNDQGRELAQGLLKALNEKQRIQEVEDGRFCERPVALTECLRFYTETEYIPEGYLCLSCQDVNQSAAAANASTMPAALKRTLIYNPPAILVLHLKRFERTATGFVKRSDRVSYEELLDLGPYCCTDCQRIDPEEKNVWYSLYGVVVHSGSLDCGHYIAYVKNGEPNAESTKRFLQEKFLNRDEVASAQRKKPVSGVKTAERKVMWQPKPTTRGSWTYVSDSYTRPSTSDEALNQEAFMLFYERVPK